LIGADFLEDVLPLEHRPADVDDFFGSANARLSLIVGAQDEGAFPLSPTLEVVIHTAHPLRAGLFSVISLGGKPMTWFEVLTGFRETSPGQVRRSIAIDGDTWTSLVNGRTFTCGRLETPSLGELRHRVARSPGATGRLSVTERVADVSDLHAEGTNAGCLFQVASQFNLLEMVSPRVTPEQGVGIYENDPTQGPACAIAAGVGTIYRNYFVARTGAPGNQETGRSTVSRMSERPWAIPATGSGK